MATTQPATATCLLDQIGSSVTIDSVARVVAMLWSLPASLLTIAGYRFVFDRPPAAVVATYVDVSRALVPLLTAFTVVLGAIWLVRSGRSLLTENRRPPISWGVHVGLGVAAVLLLSAANATSGPRVSTALAVGAAGCGFGFGLVVPRWLRSIPHQGDRSVVGWSVLAMVMAFEVTIGWFHSMTVVDGASAWSGTLWSGSVLLARGLIMCVAIAAVVVWARTPKTT